MDGTELRNRRKALKLTQEELAEKIGLSPTFISKMESGAAKISQRTATAVMHLMPDKLDREPMLADQIERIIESALIDAGVEYYSEMSADNVHRLDFHLPAYDIAIEVKRFYSQRSADQLGRYPNMIFVQGAKAARAVAAMIRSGGFAMLDFEITRLKAERDAAEIERAELVKRLEVSDHELSAFKMSGGSIGRYFGNAPEGTNVHREYVSLMKEFEKGLQGWTEANTRLHAELEAEIRALSGRIEKINAQLR